MSLSINPCWGPSAAELLRASQGHQNVWWHCDMSSFSYRNDFNSEKKLSFVFAISKWIWNHSKPTHNTRYCFLCPWCPNSTLTMRPTERHNAHVSLRSSRVKSRQVCFLSRTLPSCTITARGKWGRKTEWSEFFRAACLRGRPKLKSSSREPCHMQSRLMHAFGQNTSQWTGLGRFGKYASLG